MAILSEILAFFDAELNPSSFNDSSLNGLQVQGAPEVKKIAASVDSGLSVVKQAIEIKADLLLVHHGIFWGKDIAVTDVHRDILKSLLDNEINLVAQHLPLDACPKYGNNYSLARLLELSSLVSAAEYHGCHIGCIGENSKCESLQELSDKLRSKLEPQTNHQVLAFGPKVPEKICIVSGSAADQLYKFKDDGFDTFITGEPKQFAYHFCRDNCINAVFAGHYATETLGVKNLAKATAERFGIEFDFINLPTGI